jgi:hypothetical protein
MRPSYVAREKFFLFCDRYFAPQSTVRHRCRSCGCD